MKYIIHINTGKERKVTDQQALVMINTGRYELKRGTNAIKHTTQPSLQGEV